MRNKKRVLAACLLVCTVLSNICMPQKALAYSAAAHSSRMQSADQKEQKADYVIHTDKAEYKDDNGKIRGIVSFSYPQFAGTSDEVKKINRQLKKKSRKYFQSDSAESIKKFTQLSIANDSFFDETEQYYWTTVCDAAYDHNGIVSFHMTEEWYAGGVHNQYDYGLNYNLNSGKKLTIRDVIAGSSKKELLKAARAYCGSDTAAYEIIKNTKNYKFYFVKGNVYICYGSYELHHGTSCDEFAVKGRY